MTPRIDPALPLVWRTPTDVQLGSPEPIAVVPGADPADLQLIGLLRAGASDSTVRTVAAALDVPAARLDHLLGCLAPAFLDDEQPSAAAGGLVAVDAAGTIAPGLAEDVAEALRALGHRVVAADDVDGEAVAVAILFGGWSVSPASHQPWLRRDVPHLAVTRVSAGALVGPLVDPGTGPCLRCVDLARRDADPAWPAVAAQLAGRPAAALDARSRHDVAATVVGAVDDHIRQRPAALRSASVLIGPEGRRSFEHAPHPECGCLLPGGSATAPGPRAGRPDAAPSSPRADAALA